MKRFFLIIPSIAMIAGCSTDAIAAIRVLKEDGGPNGYYTVIESHQDRYDGLWCKDPGISACAWITPPAISTRENTYHIEDIEKQVYDNIRLNVLEGAVSLDGEYVVTWHGTDIFNYELDVNPNE